MSKQVLTRTSGNINFSASATQYWALTGSSGGNNTENRAYNPIAIAGTLSELVVELENDVVSGSIAFDVMKNGVATSPGVSFSTGSTRQTDEASSFIFSAGDTLSIRLTPTSTPTVGEFTVSFLLEGDTSAEYVTMGGTNANITADSTDRYIAANSNSAGGWATTLDLAREMIVPHDTTLDSLYVEASGNTSATFRLVKNGTETGSTITLSSSSSGSITGVALDLAAGDSLAVRGNCTSSADRIHFGIGYTADMAGESIYGSCNDDSPSTSAQEFNIPDGDISARAFNDTNFFNFRTVAGVTSFNLKNLIVEVTTAPGAASSGNQYTFNAYKNNTTDLSTVVLFETETQDQGSGSDGIVDTDDFSFAITPASTPDSTGLLHWAWVQEIAEAGTTHQLAGTLATSLALTGAIAVERGLVGTLISTLTLSGNLSLASESGTAAYSLRKVQFGLETTPGQAVAADTELVGEAIYAPTVSRWRPFSLTGTRSLQTVSGGSERRRGSLLRIESQLDFEQILLFLDTGLGGRVTTGSGPYTHTYLPDLDGAPAVKAATFEYLRSDGSAPNPYEREFAFGTTRRLAVELAEDQTGRIAAELFGRAEQSTTVTGSLSPLTRTAALAEPEGRRTS